MCQMALEVMHNNNSFNKIANMMFGMKSQSGFDFKKIILEHQFDAQ